MKILVLSHGFVLAGLMNNNTLTKGWVVRRWGTKAGLQELADKGPLTNTVLDPVTDVEISPAALIFTIKCNNTQWDRWLIDNTPAT